jgi:hypothetical protein
VTARRAFLLFAAALAAFHNLPPSFAGARSGDYFDLLTPFAVLGATLLLLRLLDANALPLAVAFVGGVLYTDGHGIHLAANSIGHEGPTGHVRHVTKFWDERFGHIEWHLGWFVLVLAVCLAERRALLRDDERWPLWLAAVLLAFTLFADTVEGGTWWLELVAAAGFLGWAAGARRPLLMTSAAAFGLAAAMIGIWAIWHGGVPQFSELGWI